MAYSDLTMLIILGFLVAFCILKFIDVYGKK
jgi:hypothetical protein